MLTPEQVRSFLGHPDKTVCRHALRYFEDASPAGAFTADDLWPLIERQDDNADELTPLSLSAAADLAAAPQTESSLQKLLGAVRSTDDHINYHFQRAIRDLPYPLLEIHRETILGNPNLRDEVRDHLNLRLRIAGDPTPVLWQRLMDHGRALDDSYADKFDYSESDALVDALGRRGPEAGEFAMAMLNDPAAAEDWREIFAVRVLGAARHVPAIAPLIEKFAIDADVLREQASKALVRIGTAEVVQRLTDFYRGKEWDVRLYAGGPFEKLKLPESEAALIELLQIEDEHDLRTNLQIGLCILGSLAGLEISRPEIQAEPEDREILHLCEMLLATATMHGVELPETDAWRKRFRRRDRRAARKAAQFSQMFADSRFGPSDAEKGIAQRDESRRSAAGTIDELLPPGDLIAPIRREGTKIGRNDPCPCGSGKKYKKCCGPKTSPPLV